MGWVWRDEDEPNDSNSFDMAEFQDPNANRSSYSLDGCSTRKIVQSKCNTEEVEPGKFIRKCEKTEQILRDCVGKPTEIVQSNKEYTEEDVTGELKNGSPILSANTMLPFEFPGLRSDIEAIERSVFGGISRFFGVADEMRNEFSRLLDDPSLFSGASSSSRENTHSRPNFEGTKDKSKQLRVWKF
ncbi:fra a 1-associated protein [Beta vulgaris subsp. vulgaris]|uniref:fra a 1-associated protein n=1 Tax=Beta vulgaris subsp. vulgaris TaxID=3555 RepID=UPI0025474E79|nr:fra a 1-associated protein [Beta vulgaris subsp. vulgaris]